MNFDSGTRTRLLVDMTLDFDPAGTTLEVAVDGTWYPATWQDTATAVAAVGTPGSSGYKPPKWYQTGQTTGYFAGPQVASPGSAVVLALGTHSFATRVTSGADVIESPDRPLEIRVAD